MSIKRIIAKGLRYILQPPAITNSMIDKTARVCSGTQINESRIERYSYVGHDCFLINVSIGPFCSIADNCRLGGAQHPMEYVSTSPVFNQGKNIMKKNFAFLEVEAPKKITISADVWIASDVIIKSGVEIGVGAVIGAGSVVTHDVPPYEIWAGNPAKKIKDRFTEEIKNGLLRSEWWKYEEEILENYATLFNNPNEFLQKIQM